MRRLSIRILVATALCAAVAGSAAAPIPREENGTPALPAVALKQPGVYRLEVALAIFYGGLLLITPVFSGLVVGRLPIQISAHGARFAEEADQTSETAEAAIRTLEDATGILSERLRAADLEIKRINQLLNVTTHSQR